MLSIVTPRRDVGDKGMIEVEAEDNAMILMDHGGGVISHVQSGYNWQHGAAHAAASLATGRELLVTPEHALHVLEVITAARESQETGHRVALRSTFKWPLGS